MRWGYGQSCGYRQKARKVGGQVFGRSHIHHILRNPIYAGRIRHRDAVFEGLHAAIIAPKIWEDVQKRLQIKAPHLRGARIAATCASPLIGKVFDESGDRLTPSHANKRGKRHRYYVSSRLLKSTGEKGIPGWRLPAHQLEEQITDTLRRHLDVIATGLNIYELTTNEILRIGMAVKERQSDPRSLLKLVERIDIAAGTVKIRLSIPAMTDLLDLSKDRLHPAALKITEMFQLRKRGVETKLIIGASQKARDEVLIRNIANAHRWLGMLKAGKTFDEIAADNNISKRRIQQVIEWALLAPDIVQMRLEGRQPIGLTSNWFVHHRLPSDRNAQRQLIAIL